ncbi:RDD family protein [Reichenbachiella sp.]|uniref:RDD family protein n=1 Tax=Reichenbachiella sp. TaxID=2184521 RepID=UPI003B5B593E
MSLPSETKFATFPQRLFAFNIDFLFILILMAPLSYLIEDDLTFGGVVLVLVSLYHAILEGSGWRATFGKKYSNIEVVNEQGDGLSFGQSLLRIVTKYLSLLLFFGGFFMIYFRRDRKGLHDLVAKTYVVDRG